MQTPEDRFYNPAKINGWFAVSAVLALAAGVAAILADHYDREWKDYQRAFHRIEKDRADSLAGLEGADPSALPPGAADVRNALLFEGGTPAGGSNLSDEAFAAAREAVRNEADFAAGAALAARFYEQEAASMRTAELLAEQARIEEARRAAEDERFEAEQEQRGLQALVDEHKFSMDHARAQGHEHELVEAEALWKEAVQREAEAHARMDAAARAKSDRNNELKTLLSPMSVREARAKGLLEMSGVAGARRKIDSWIAKGLRDAPMLDFIAPVTRIEQKVLPDLTVDYNFAQVPRVDRCMTCHSGIDKVKVDPKTGEVTPLYTAENTPDRVFRTHPRPELFASSVSSHSADQVGCTVCHDGLGWGLTFQDAYHTPSTEEQEKEWEEKYHWHRGESWTMPMLPMKHVEASCAKCHRDPAATKPADSFAKEIPQAPRWNRGQRLVEEKGCFGCHKIDGYAVPGLDKWLAEIPSRDEREAALATAQRKTGPSLLRVSSKWKSDREAWKWIWNPSGLRPTTNMPHFFGQPNNRGTDPLTGVNYDLRTRTEVSGITTYLWKESEPWERPVPMSLGNAENGKMLFGSAEEGVGCISCHSTKDFPNPSGGPANNFGPELSTVGSKVGEDWLFLWMRNPSDYWHGTRMPSLRLTVGEAKDIAAYLASLRDEKWEAEPVPAVDEATVRVLALEAARVLAKAGEDPVAMVDGLDLQGRLHLVGKRAITRYACFGCHEIRGFEAVDRIGTQLGGNEGWGSKDVDRLDFGLMKDPKAVEVFKDWGAELVPHRKPEWARLKLLNPRVYDAGVTKQPLEKLLMPNFHFTEEEADAVVTYLLSMQVGEIKANKRPARGPEDIAAEKMRWLVRDYNCYGCHTVTSEVLPTGEGGEWKARPRGGDIRPWILDGEGNPNKDFWPPTLGGESTLREQAKERAHLTGMKPEEIKAIREVGEGTKVQPAWLHRFLRDPGATSLRYWLKVRMPTFDFTEAQLNALIHGFAAEDRVPFPFEDRKYDDLDEAGRAKARDFFQTLECAKCHPVRGAGGPPPSGAAPDLTYSRERLRPDWVALWLKDPAVLQPGTKMPPFWAWDEKTLGPASATGPGDPKYDNDPHRQMRAILDYVFDIGRTAAPSR